VRMHTDEYWMRKALALARRAEGRTRPNPPVGAVVVRGNKDVGHGYHRKAGGPHAEIYALREAGEQARGATLYVTLEPCCTVGRTGPCTEAVAAAGVACVVASVRDPNPLHSGRGLARLRRQGIRVTEGVCAKEGRLLIRPFAKWVTAGLPFVTLKMGMTLDGRIADGKGISRWITGGASRTAVRQMRRRADAILVGSRTALADDPSLLSNGRGEPAWRIIADSSGRLPAGARVLTDGQAGHTIIATTRRCPCAQAERYRSHGARVWTLPAREGRVALKSLLAEVGKMGLLHLLCEGGGELAEALIREGRVDEYVFFIAPRVLGGRGVPVVGGRGWRLESAPRLKFTRWERMGKDMLLCAEPEKG